MGNDILRTAVSDKLGQKKAKTKHTHNRTVVSKCHTAGWQIRPLSTFECQSNLLITQCFLPCNMASLI